MKIGMMRLGMSLMLVVGFWTNRLPAQEILVVPEVHYEPARHSPGAPLQGRSSPGPAADHAARRTLNHFGMGCKDDPYYTTCGSWRYEVHFIFGSCRSFFSQECAPNQPCADRRNQR